MLQLIRIGEKDLPLPKRRLHLTLDIIVRQASKTLDEQNFGLLLEYSQIDSPNSDRYFCVLPDVTPLPEKIGRLGSLILQHDITPCCVNEMLDDLLEMC